jgi:hypothetical protein
VRGSVACEFALHQLLGVATSGDQYIYCSDSGDDLDPSLVYRLEPLSLLLGILVWDGADGVVRLPSLSILWGWGIRRSVAPAKRNQADQ